MYRTCFVIRYEWFISDRIEEVVIVKNEKACPDSSSVLFFQPNNGIGIGWLSRFVEQRNQRAQAKN